MTRRQRREAFDNLVMSVLMSDRIRRAPVGRALDYMPEDVREVLRELKAEDINYRPDAILL